jgi:hypothetical protein
MPLSKIVIIADPAQYLSGWIIFGLCKLDFGNGIGNIERFLGNWEIFASILYSRYKQNVVTIVRILT